MSLISEQIKGIQDLPREPVATPEWPGVDGKVFARRLSGDERDEWESFQAHSLDQDKFAEDNRLALMKIGTKKVRATMVAMGACDEDGDSIFSTSDVIWLGLKACEPLERIRDTIMRLSGMRDSDEDSAKNLPQPPGESLPSDSALPSDTLPAEDSSGS